MKKLMIYATASMGLFVANAQAQVVEVKTISHLETIGYTVNQSAQLGEFNGKEIFRAQFSTNDRCPRKLFGCKQCVGCCRSSFVDFTADGIIVGIGDATTSEPSTGRMMFNPRTNEDFTIPGRGGVGGGGCD